MFVRKLYLCNSSNILIMVIFVSGRLRPRVMTTARKKNRLKQRHKCMTHELPKPALHGSQAKASTKFYGSNIRFGNLSELPSPLMPLIYAPTIVAVFVWHSKSGFESIVLPALPRP